MAYRRRRRAFSVGSYRTGWNSQVGSRASGGYGRKSRMGDVYPKKTGRSISPRRKKSGTRSYGYAQPTASMDKGVNATVRRYIHKPGKNHTTSVLKRTHTMNNSLGKSRSIPAIGTVGKMARPSSPVIPSPGHVPYKVTHDRQAKNVANASISRVLHRTHVDTGMPITSILKRVKKQTGTQKERIFDTKINYNSNNLRSLLDFASGFNCKKYVGFPTNASITAGDVNLFANVNDSGTSETSHEKALLAIEYLESQFHFYNQSIHFPVHMKFHMIKLGDRDYVAANNPQESINDDCFNDLSTTQEPGRMPIRQQYENKNIVTATEGLDSQVFVQMTSVDAQPFKSSSRFRSNHEVVKTVSKKLEPGDSWVVRHRHHCGAGLDMFALRQQAISANRNETAQPISYAYVLEFYGVPVEGLRKFAQTTPRPYLGVSPAYINYEFRKTIKAVNSTIRTGPDVLASGLNQGNIYMRTFIDQTYRDTTKEYFALPSSITDDLSTIAQGQVFIPVVTDKAVVGHTGTAGQLDQ